MFRWRRRSVAVRAGVVAAVVGLTALTALPGAGAAMSAPRSAATTVSSATTAATSATSAEGDTKCVAWGTGGLGLKCTDTYGGNTAWDPWTKRNLPASDPPTVTISQAKDLTDQNVQINWYNFTPSLGNTATATGHWPNPTLASLFQVSIFECEGTAPTIADTTAAPGGATGYSGSQCYLHTVEDTIQNGATQGTGNAVSGTTLDTAQYTAPSTITDFTPNQAYLGNSSPWDGGDPSTWTGQANFHVEAPTPRTKPGFFNCSTSQPCFLVVDPNWGGTPTQVGSQSNDLSYTDTSGCNTHNFGGGLGPSGATNGDLAGDLGSGHSGSADNLAPGQIIGFSVACWVADRIIIPLSFASTSKNCPNKPPQFYAQGSMMMQLQMLQWLAGWCVGQEPVAADFVPNSDAQARNNFLAASQIGSTPADMALVTLPADASAQQASSRKFTYAPLANSGTGIAYYVDDARYGTQLNGMVLNPRLLAKLTTQSYSLQYGCLQPYVNNPPWPSQADAPSPVCDPAVIHNPYSLFDDPEFSALNQNCQPFGQPTNYTCSTQHPIAGRATTYDDFPTDQETGPDIGEGAFLPTVVAIDSDMTYNLSGWTGANTDASNFLNGSSDPWGTHVNNNYVHVSYPVSAYALQDNGITYPGGVPCTPQQCVNDAYVNASMNVTWIAQPDLDTIANDLLSYTATGENPVANCPLSTGTCSNPNEMGFQGLGQEPQNKRALLSELDLGDIANYNFPAAKLVNAGGVAVGPTQASIEAAVKDMSTNPDGITQYANYASTDKAAYPLAMVDYAMVPTCGLSSAKASAIADFLTKVATTGQTHGEAPGNLAPGYYPLTAKQKAQTLAAADDVKTQDCKSTPVDHTISGHPNVNDTSTTTTPKGNHPGSTTPSTPKKGGTSPAGSPTGNPQVQTAAFGQKSPYSGLTGILLLLAIIAGLLLLIGGPTAWVITATGKWPVVLRWLGPVVSRLRAARTWLTGHGFGRA